MTWPTEPPSDYPWVTPLLEDPSVAVTEPPISVTSNTVRYGDVAALLSGELPEPPAPTVLRRSDGHGLFYAGQVNSLFGEPESGKTWIALAAVAEVLQ